MLFRLFSTSSLLVAAAADHARPSSLLQISSLSENAAAPSVDAFLSTMQQDVEKFQHDMDAEVKADEDQIRKMLEQQRKLEREEKAFKAKVLAQHEHPAKSSLLESSVHFGDPYIDEAMRVIGDEINAQKRELQRRISPHGAAPGALVQEQEKRPELGLIADALKTRLNMVGKF